MSAPASELGSGQGGRERVVFGLVIPPAAAEQAHLFLGRRAGNMTAAMSMESPGDPGSFHFISLIYLNSFIEV